VEPKEWPAFGDRLLDRAKEKLADSATTVEGLVRESDSEIVWLLKVKPEPGKIRLFGATRPFLDHREVDEAVATVERTNWLHDLLNLEATQTAGLAIRENGDWEVVYAI